MNKKSIILGSILLLVISISAVFFNSCSEGIDNDYNNLKQIDGALSFKNNQDLHSSLAMLADMETEERIEWEASKGFKSFATASEEVYFSKNTEDFKSFEEIEEFAAKNSKYVVLFEDEFGELHLEPRMMDDPARYLLNEDEVFYVKGQTLNSPEDLKLAMAQMPEQLNSNISVAAASPSLKSTTEVGNIDIPGEVVSPPAQWCGTFWDRVTSGSNRTMVHIQFLAPLHSTMINYKGQLVDWTYQNVKLYVKCTKKTWGVWVLAPRSIQCGLSGDVYFKYNNVWRKFTVNDSFSSSGRTYSKHYNCLYAPGHVSLQNHVFGAGFTIWADTPSTSTITVVCH